ncbi:MAG: hypothetical protein VZQ55_01450 [Ruminococcus sp.]|nr:hypothetical protein [Ruminococcus sp.]
MRSSNYKNSNQLRHVKSKKTKKISKLASVIITSFVLFAAVVIPSVALIQNVQAVTNVKNNVFNIGGSKVFSDVISRSDEFKVRKTVKKIDVKKLTETIKPAQSEKKASTPKVKAIVNSTKVDDSYNPKHISLSTYDRKKLERLVMGEAGGLGYKGAALVAQTIRDTMQLEKNSSIDYIISSYQYEGSTQKEPTSTVKKAVSYIFDNDGYAVKHRLIYFYASDLIESEWHETQDYIACCGSERFFDRAD